MTPEPDAGYYVENRTEGFVRKYGRQRVQGDIYFTGTHKCGQANVKTGMRMILDGYNEETKRIEKVTGGLTLIDKDGENAAIWTFAKLIEHWGRKHAHAVYVPYKRRNQLGINEFQYRNPLLIGEGSDFNLFLEAFRSGAIIYDPGSKLFTNEKGNSQTKARNQFRMKSSDLYTLYSEFNKIDLHEI